MVLNILVLVLIGVVAYFHYTQGFFTATLSAIIALFSAVVAVSYNETLVHLILRGSFADQAHAIALVSIFAVCYGVLRTVFDKAIPGNVRTPSTVDKIGAALMGVVAGIFGSGILVIAMQMLPFGPALGFMDFERYPMKSESVVVPVADKGQSIDSTISDRLQKSTLDPVDRSALWLPVDDIVMYTANKLSNGGLPGGRTMDSIHPQYLDELFAERLGIQTGAFRSAIQFAKLETIKVPEVYQVAELSGYDSERPEIRNAAPLSLPSVKAVAADTKPAEKSADKTKPQQSDIPPTRYTVSPPKGQSLLIVRVHLDDQASPEDNGIFRFSPGAIRLVAKVGDGYVDYHPIGTMQGTDLVLLNAVDDFLFVNLKERHGFDAVFMVDSSVITGKPAALAPETFISIKRYANIDLSDKQLEKGKYEFSPTYVVYRNKPLVQYLKLPEIKSEGDAADDAKNKK